MASFARTFSSTSGTRVDVEALNIVALCGVVLVTSLLLLIWSAHLGRPPSATELDVMSWI